jgi:hypothetical protein
MTTLDDGIQRDAIRAAAKSIYESTTGLPWEEATRRTKANHYFIAKDSIVAALPHMALSDVEEINELRRLVARVETMDFGGYTQRDAYSVADTIYSAGYRRAL